MAPRLLEQYQRELHPALMETFGYRNGMQAPTLAKIILNVGLGDSIQESRVLDAATNDLAVITGQKPVITRAKRSVAAFKVRQGMPIGAMVTLRKHRMWDFLDRLISVGLPRVRDFQGISPDSFDGRGNYTLGVREQLIFPEIDYDQIDKVRGFEINIVTTASTDEEGYQLLLGLGMPFHRDDGRYAGVVAPAAPEQPA